MKIVGRYEKARILNTHSGILSPPIIFDTKKDLFLPYDKDAWADFLPSVRDTFFCGSTQFNFLMAMPLILNFYSPGSASQNNTALNSAYTAGSAGACIGYLFWQSTNSNITDIYFFISSFTGTAANVNDINIEIRSYSAANNKPDTSGGGLLGSTVYDPTSTTGWNRVTGLNVAVTQDNRFFVVIADADGAASPCANVNQVTSFTSQMQTNTLAHTFGCLSSTSGFSSITYSTGSNIPSCVVVHADGLVQGNSITSSSNHTSNTVQRGLYVADIPFSCKVFSMYHNATSVFAWSGKVFDGTTAPGGTEIAASAGTLTLEGVTSYGCLFKRPFPTIHANNSYRLVMKPASNSTNPVRHVIGTGVDSNLKKARPGYGSWYQTDENGGSWTDTDSEIPAMGIVVEDITSETSVAIDVNNQRNFPRIPLGY